jgi:hypothetical protein
MTINLGSEKENRYDQFSYRGMVNRIRDGVSLTPHQLKTMELCGLTVEDFRNQKTETEKIELINRLRSKSPTPSPRSR